MENKLARATELIRAAMYARVSSDQQEEEETIASQVAALTERVSADGLTLDAELRFVDDGYTGTTLVRWNGQCA